jgi:hypothetical protein
MSRNPNEIVRSWIRLQHTPKPLYLREDSSSLLWVHISTFSLMQRRQIKLSRGSSFFYNYGSSWLPETYLTTTWPFSPPPPRLFLRGSMVQYFDRGNPGGLQENPRKEGSCCGAHFWASIPMEKFNKRNLNPRCAILQFLLETALATLAVRNDLLLVGKMVELESIIYIFEEVHSIPSPWMELYVALRTPPPPQTCIKHGDLPFSL